MMKKRLAMALAVTMAAGVVLAGCGGGGASGGASGGGASGGASAGSDGAAEGGASIQLLNGKPEIDAQMQELAAKYKEETGNTIEVMTIGGNETSSSKLKELKQAGEMPDIFVAEANQFANWKGELADLSG